MEKQPKIWHNIIINRRPWKIIPSVRCSVCGRPKQVASRRCTRFMLNTCEMPYIHAYTHTLLGITWDTFVPGSTLWCWINMRMWPHGISGPAQSHHPSISPSLWFILQVQCLQWLTYYIRQETLICSLSSVHMLLRGNSAHSHNIFVDRWWESAFHADLYNTVVLQ